MSSAPHLLLRLVARGAGKLCRRQMFLYSHPPQKEDIAKVWPTQPYMLRNLSAVYPGVCPEA